LLPQVYGEPPPSKGRSPSPKKGKIAVKHVGIVYEGSRAHLVSGKLRLAEFLKPE
jgi:hypothetical protein